MKTEWEFEWANKEKFEENRKELIETYNKFVSKWKSDSNYLNNPKSLREALDEYELLVREFYHGGAEGYYYWLKQELNEMDLDIRAKYNSFIEFITIEGNKLSFFTIELGKISEDKQKEFLNNNDLKKYRTFLKEVFSQAKYMLTEKEEMIMGLKSKTSHSMWEKMVSSLLIKETRKIDGEEKNYTELLSLMKGKNKRLRDLAKNAFEEILNKYSDIAENEINAIIDNHKTNDLIRGYKREDSARLISENISEEFIDCLMNTVSSRFDLSSRYYKLKAKLLNQDKIGYHERATETGKMNKMFNWNESKNIVHKTFEDLDPEFSKIFDKFLEDGRIDVLPKKGKRSGAFCVKTTMGLPTYILLNHTGKLDEVTTLAHELGHGINNEMIRKKHHALYFDTPTATAEVASTFMEDFVLDKILENVNEEEKLSILMNKLDSDIASIMRQVAAYLFERELHQTYRKEGYLSKDRIGKMFKKHMKAYLGESVDCSTVDNWWIYWGHFRSMFYVYSYASGLLISKAMQQKYKEDNSFIEKVKEFLSSGTSETPDEIFKKMGITINEGFWKSGLQKIEDLLEETEELARKLNR